jgi:hypothetical protein
MYKLKSNQNKSDFFLLSEGIIDVSPIRLPSPEPSFTAERHQLVGGVGVVHVGVERVVEHVAGFLPTYKIKRNCY